MDFFLIRTFVILSSFGLKEASEMVSLWQLRIVQWVLCFVCPVVASRDLLSLQALKKTWLFLSLRGGGRGRGGVCGVGEWWCYLGPVSFLVPESEFLQN